MLARLPARGPADEANPAAGFPARRSAASGLKASSLTSFCAACTLRPWPAQAKRAKMRAVVRMVEGNEKRWDSDLRPTHKNVHSDA
mmetsp:Transcript_20586/g.38570  ORF Transcript_20586/g.38570 Transcript_20586/m.38570 type:complete len:86 (+) Transcript_20586:143-400(+)